MGNIIKSKRLKWEFVKKEYPVLAETIDILEREMIHKQADNNTIKEYVAGLCLEIALKADGTPDLFFDELDIMGTSEDDWTEDF